MFLLLYKTGLYFSNMDRREILKSFLFGNTTAKKLKTNECPVASKDETLQPDNAKRLTGKWHTLHSHRFAHEDISVQGSQDWIIEDGSLKCIVHGMNKTVNLLTHQLSGDNQPACANLIFRFLNQPDTDNNKDDYAGFRLGLGVRGYGELATYKALNAGVTRDGYMLFGTKYSERKIEESKLTEKIRLQLTIIPKATGGNFAKLKTMDQAGNTLATMSTDTYEASAWQGDILLVSHFKNNKHNRDQPTIEISTLEISGEKIICMKNNSKF
jgi:hypothetical protein